MATATAAKQQVGKIVQIEEQEIAGAKLEVLERMPIRLLGAILNDVPRGAAYGYYAYYSYYLPGYEAVEEREARQTAGPLVV